MRRSCRLSEKNSRILIYLHVLRDLLISFFFSPELALNVNVDCLNNVFRVARRHSTANRRIRLMVPSSISAFGVTTPLECTPNETIQNPNTIYGVSKVYAEMMGSYLSQVENFFFFFFFLFSFSHFSL